MKRALLILLICGSAAVQAEARLDGPYFVGSGGTPYRDSCGLSTAQGMNLANVETDPRVTFDRRTRRLYLSFMQDPVVGIRAAFSADLGRNWELRDPPGLSACSAPGRDTFGDQDIAIGADGSVALISVTGNLVIDKRDRSSEGYAFDGTIQFSRSTDRGNTWSAPVVISRGGVYQHTAMIAAPESTPGVLYAAWATIPNPPGLLPGKPHLTEGFVYLSRSRDAGRSWSAPVAIAPGLQLWDLKIVGDRSIVAFVDGHHLVKSDDSGSTWSKPLDSPITIVNSAIYEVGGAKIMAGDLPLAVGPRGQLYMVGSTATSGAGAALQFARSANLGRTWSAPLTVATSGGVVFHATLSSDADGRLAVMWYDTPNVASDKGSHTLMTTVNVAWSTDHGATWATRRVSQPFDMSRAPTLFGARYLGNYQALTCVGPGEFVGVYALAPPIARAGNADLQAFRLSIDAGSTDLR